MGRHKILLGREGEKIAEEYLVGRGYTLVQRNYRSPYGEVDLICQQEGTLVFVEVKTRSNRVYGYPEDAVNAQKQQHLIDAAEFFVQEKGWEGDWRIDVVAVLRGSAGKIEVEHLENAVSR